MILGILWRAFQAQLHRLAGYFWEPDPIALMQLEYDRAVVQLREGREGLADYRSLVERVARQVARNAANVERLDATVRTCLRAGDRESAGRYVLDLQRARRDLADNQGQLQLHETAYENNLLKIQQAGKKLTEIRNKIARYDSELRMSAAEAEMAKLAQEFHVDPTTDFGRLDLQIQEKIDLNRARVRVAADLSNDGVAEIRQEQAAQNQVAEDILKDFEQQIAQETHATARSLSASPRRRQSEES